MYNYTQNYKHSQNFAIAKVKPQHTTHHVHSVTLLCVSWIQCVRVFPCCTKMSRIEVERKRVCATNFTKVCNFVPLPTLCASTDLWSRQHPRPSWVWQIDILGNGLMQDPQDDSNCGFCFSRILPYFPVSVRPSLRPPVTGMTYQFFHLCNMS